MRRQLITDLVCVSLFAAIGRLSHGESLLGWPTTVWPFLVGLVVGWGVLILRRDVTSPVAGLLATAAVVVVGMLVRHLVGQGTAPSFIVVATIVNGLLLIGSRLLWLRRTEGA